MVSVALGWPLLLPHVPGIHASKGLRQRHKSTGPQIADVENQFLSQPRKHRRSFHGKAGLQLSIFEPEGRPGGSRPVWGLEVVFSAEESDPEPLHPCKARWKPRAPGPFSPTHMPRTWSATLPVYKLPPFSAWFSSNRLPSPVM